MQISSLAKSEVMADWGEVEAGDYRKYQATSELLRYAQSSLRNLQPQPRPSLRRRVFVFTRDLSHYWITRVSLDGTTASCALEVSP